MIEALIFCTVFLLLSLAYLLLGFYRQQKSATENCFKTDIINRLLPSICQQFSKVELIPWQKESLYQQDYRDLRALGFGFCGFYQCTDMGQLIEMSLWGNERNGVYGIVKQTRALSHQADEQSWQYTRELCIAFSDASSLTVSDDVQGQTLPRPAAHKRLLSATQNGFPSLFRGLKHSLPLDKKISPLQEPIQFYKQFSFFYHSWLRQEEQIRSKELSQPLRRAGVEMDRHTAATIALNSSKRRSTEISEEVVNNILLELSVDDKRWQYMQERLLVINDQMQQEELLACLSPLLESPDDKQRSVLESFRRQRTLSSAVKSMESMVNQLRLKSKIRLFATVKQPTYCHVYFVA